MQSHLSPLTCTLVIPTVDRPQELRECLESVPCQTRLPDHVLVMDDGESDEAQLRALFAGTPVEFLYHRKTERKGLTRSRNLAARMASTEVLIYLDDDVVLEPEYVAEIMALYEADVQGDLGGVGGVITNFHMGRIECVYELLRGRPRWGHGRVFPSGLSQCNYNAVRETKSVDWLGGGVSSYRRAVVLENPFHEGYANYALYEDLEMSYRVSRRWRLLITPRARLAHHPGLHSIHRQPYRFACQQIANLWYHYARNMPHRLLNRVAFSWMIISMLAADVGGLLFLPHRFRLFWPCLRGHARATWEGVTGNNPLLRASAESPDTSPGRGPCP